MKSRLEKGVRTTLAFCMVSLSVCLALLLGTALYLPALAKAQTQTPESGQCGANVTFQFDSATGVLRISGKGNMRDYDANSGKSPFSGQEDIKSVFIENGVTSVGKWAFYDCFSLKSVSLGKDVQTVSESAFYGCVKINEAMMQEGITVIEGRAFEHCKALNKLTLPESVIYIGKYAFDNTGYYRKKSNWEKKALYFGSFLLTGKYNEAYLDSKRQGDKPYVSDVHQSYKTSGMVTGNYTVKPGTKMIAEDAFRYCRGMTGITFPKDIQKIGQGAFAGTKLTHVTIPEGITAIEAETFRGCSSLKSVAIPKSVTEIGKKAFDGCSALEDFTIPKGVIVIDDGAFAGSGLKSVTIPKNVRGIGDEAFSNCKSLKKVTIQSGVKAVGEAAFRDCANLKSVTVPKSVTVINRNAFGYKGGGYNEKAKGFKIKGYKGSAAQKYAKDNKIKFVILSRKK